MVDRRRHSISVMTKLKVAAASSKMGIRPDSEMEEKKKELTDRGPQHVQSIFSNPENEK